MTELIYVECPACYKPIEEPFAVHDAPVTTAFVHNRSRRGNCRIVVTVHPDGEYVATDVPRDVSLEDALSMAIVEIENDPVETVE